MHKKPLREEWGQPCSVPCAHPSIPLLTTNQTQPMAPSPSPCLPQTNQEHPRNPFTTHLSSSASTLGPKVGGINKSTIPSAGTLCPRRSLLSKHPFHSSIPTRPGMQVRCKSQLPGLVFPQRSCTSSSFQGFAWFLKKLSGILTGIQAGTGKMRPLSCRAGQERIPDSPSHSQLDWGRQGGEKKSIN